MKLDRNSNPDGRGKYALINLRTNKVEWGDEDQFFVIKYKDRFAEAALRAYAAAVRECAASPTLDPQGELSEFAAEIEREADICASTPEKQTPD